MGNETINISGGTLLDLVEQLGAAWGDNYRPEDIRLDIGKITTLKNVNELVTRDAAVADVIKSHCPSFIRVYRQVMLRDIKEQIGNGASDQGGSA